MYPGAKRSRRSPHSSASSIPDGLLNPGVIVDPDPLDANLRLLASPPLAPQRTAMSFAGEGGLGARGGGLQQQRRLPQGRRA